jgi:hypothetical protein
MRAIIAPVLARMVSPAALKRRWYFRLTREASEVRNQANFAALNYLICKRLETVPL